MSNQLLEAFLATAPNPSPAGIEAAKVVTSGGKARRASWSDGLFLVVSEDGYLEVQDDKSPLVYELPMNELSASDWIVLNQDDASKESLSSAPVRSNPTN